MVKNVFLIVLSIVGLFLVAMYAQWVLACAFGLAICWFFDIVAGERPRN